ncbi:hypothetical protein WICPIJ_000631 [Wickerhamomyces pijperi]|uniref:Uncharacterized protein n=1 Tax=Wickerhamomyces pijperi TaxID=599730 RepID=A0A9P8QCF0_WICPI|nr:hypothetical protein WICPIJ_000631 [Wickerhamomyces pijperi]
MASVKFPFLISDFPLAHNKVTEDEEHFFDNGLEKVLSETSRNLARSDCLVLATLILSLTKQFTTATKTNSKY